MKTKDLTIDGMPFGHCVLSVNKELGGNDGPDCGGGAK
jgi:hypothetical protein